MTGNKAQDGNADPAVPPGAAPGKTLSPQAIQALEEAEERRRLAETGDTAPPERNGPAGPEPTRYGDWERKGVLSDF